MEGEIVVSFITTVILVWFFYNQGVSHGESKEKTRAFHERLDMLSPFILREFGLLSATVWHKNNFDTLEEAREAANQAITKSDLGFVHAEKVEIWHEGKLLESHITKERLPINKIQGFAYNMYNGMIHPEGYMPFDPEKVKEYNFIKVRLTNGDIVRLTSPQYSIRTNCLMGRYGSEFSPSDSTKSARFSVIPIRIIETELNP